MGAARSRSRAPGEQPRLFLVLGSSGKRLHPVPACMAAFLRLDARLGVRSVYGARRSRIARPAGRSTRCGADPHRGRVPCTGRSSPSTATAWPSPVTAPYAASIGLTPDSGDRVNARPPHPSRLASPASTASATPCATGPNSSRGRDPSVGRCSGNAPGAAVGGNQPAQSGRGRLLLSCRPGGVGG
jgi:hypothetical protein